MLVILEVEDLHIRYGKVEALHDTNLKVESGQVVTVIGPSGAGKSTMLGAIMGALPTTSPASDVVSYLGHNLTGLPVEKRVAHGMRLVPGKHELFATTSMENNLVLGAYRRKRTGERNYLDQIRVVRDLSPCLREHRAQEAGALPGGERQMLAVDHMLTVKPQLLMLDEPDLSLAPLIVKKVFHIASDLRKAGMTTLLIEQNTHATLQIADYGYVLEAGGMTLEGATQELAVSPHVIETYPDLAKKAV